MGTLSGVVQPGMSGRYHPLLALGSAGLCVGAALRATLWWQFGLDEGVALAALPSVLLRGLANDLVVTAYVLTPVLLYLTAVSGRWLQTRAHRLIVLSGSWLTLFAMVFLAVAERYFFQEFDARFNLVAFDYLAYPTEVVGDVWTEYPVLRTAAAAALLASAGVGVMRRWLPRPVRGETPA